MRRNRAGFTLIELLIVVGIIGILAAVAIPKFAATKDKAKLASVKTDVRNVETAEEAYFSDFATNGTFAQLQTASNSSIASTITSCKVQVAAGAASTVDGKITCP